MMLLIFKELADGLLFNAEEPIDEGAKAGGAMAQVF
jgi:hypothetical protein